MGHLLQSVSSSRSRRNRLGSTLLPKIRFARASTSGHFTCFVLIGRCDCSFSSSARIALKTFCRARRGSAFTCFSNSLVLIGLRVACLVPIRKILTLLISFLDQIPSFCGAAARHQQQVERNSSLIRSRSCYEIGKRRVQSCR